MMTLRASKTYYRAKQKSTLSLVPLSFAVLQFLKSWDSKKTVVEELITTIAAAEQALAADSPRAGIFGELRGRAVEAQRSAA
jgi:hypothetical protein